MKWLAFRRIEHQTSFMMNEVLPSESYRSMVFKMDVIRDSLIMFDLIPPMAQGQSEAFPVTSMLSWLPSPGLWSPGGMALATRWGTELPLSPGFGPWNFQLPMVAGRESTGE